ncbi:MAG: peptide chain release factor N(5)-glutamine methyltransferase [Peptococcia bacterium]|jgi:release factor glutamine methyltransferase
MMLNSQDRPQTGVEALQWAVSFLSEQGFTQEDAKQEARLLLAKAWQKEAWKVILESKEIIDEATWEQYVFFIKKRGSFTPLHYLLAEKEFMSLPFKVSPAVLIPRWDTEILVEEAIKLLRERDNPRILDLGTGSGAIAVSLAYYLPNASVVATDISARAIEVARENAEKLGVEKRIQFLIGNLFTPLSPREKFDLIASNPPYLNAEEIQELSPEVQQEPRIALAGGQDGLVYYRGIAVKARDYLALSGHLLLEIGWQQAISVVGILQDNGWGPLRIVRDLEGRDRVVVY